MPAGKRHAGAALDLRLLALLFAGGVLAVHALPELPSLPILVATALPALWPWRGRAAWAAACCGVLLTAWRAQAVLDARWPAERHGQDHWIVGTVADLPERQALSQRFVFAPADPAWPPRIRASWYRGDFAVEAGACLRLLLRLRTPHGSLNPAGFDYEGWLLRGRIAATASVKDAMPCAAAAPPPPLLRLRQHLVKEVHAALRDHPAAPLVAALTVGDRSGLADADWDAFRVTGTGHLVAISGFNVAIVAAAAFFLCRALASAWPGLCLRLPAQRAGMLGAALLATVYGLLAGFEPPVQRAVVMLLVLLAAAWRGRIASPSRALAAALLAVLLMDPLAVTSPGLWLSFAAVAAIFYVGLGRLRPPGAWHALVGLQLLLAVALAPLTLHFFLGASWIAPVVNLAAVPLFTLLTPLALVALLVQLAWPAAGSVLLLLATATLLDGFRIVLEWIAAHAGLWLAAAPGPAALLLAALGIACLFVPRGLPLRPLGLACLLPLAFAPVQPARGGFELTALDVGQGLAVVVRTARHALLYDAGPAFEDGFDAGESVVAPFLLSRGLHRVDALVLSHGDNDHAGGVEAVRGLLRIDREIGTPAGEPCRAGTRWRWDGVEFEVLHPDRPGWEGNDASCALRITGPFSVLLPGDIEADAEADLVGRKLPLAAEVLVSPHHGSRTSSTTGFVAAVQPQLVIHGAGWRNRFGHPRPEVVARYAGVGALQLVTGDSGAVSVWKDGDGLRVEGWRREASRFWNAPAPRPAAGAQ